MTALFGAQQPRFVSVPPRVTSAGVEATELAARAGLVLDPWQSLTLDGALGERADGKWSAFETAMVVSRQNGKGSILEARELAGLFLFGEELILHSAHEFKDLDCDTPILTSTGWSSMGALSVGDEVFAPDGQLTKVVGAHPVLRDSDCYRVTLADGQSLVTGSGHLWDVSEVARSGVVVRRVVTTEQIRCAGLVHHWSRPHGRDRNVYRWRVDIPAALHITDADLPVDPYVLGLWLGDSAGGRLTVGAADLPHVLAALDAAAESYTTRADRRWPHRVTYVNVNDLKSRLRALGVLGAKRIPASYLTASESQRRALLAGIMDSDGTVSGHQLAVTMVKRELMEDVATLVRSLGYRATLRCFRARRNGSDAGPMYRVQFAPTDCSPFRMARKTAKIVRLKTSRSAYNAIVSVERVPMRPTRCITVAHESGCYLAGVGLVPTHNTSQEAFLRIRWLIDNADEFRKRVARIRTSHGDEGVELLPAKTMVTGFSGRHVTVGKAPRLRFVARTSGSGRGFSGDVVILDEAFNLPSQVISALMPTMSARPNPQLWYASSAVNQEEHPHGEVLTAIRLRGLAGDDPSLAYFEWSADEVAYRADPGATACDPQQWAAANPGLGIRISVEHVGREHRSMPSKSFAVERLGIGDWPDLTPGGARVIDPNRWDALCDPQSQLEGSVVFAVDATPERSHAAIAAAGVRADGLLHAEVIADRPGTGWLLQRLIELHATWGPRAIVLDPSSAAGSLIPGLQEAGIEPVLVSGREMAQACGSFYDLVVESGGLRHLGQLQLSSALAGARKRDLGDAWAWHRKDSTVNISPLVAVTLAVHGCGKPVEEEQPFFAMWV